MTLLEEDRAYVLAKLGKLAQRTDYPAETLAWMQGRVPDSMIDFLATIGLGTYGNGKWQTADALRYDGILSQTFQGDPDFSAQDCTVFGISAFGRVWGWHRVYQSFGLSVLPNQISVPKFFQSSGLDEQRAALVSFSTIPNIGGDEFDENGDGMFARLVSAHGPLKLGHIFAPRLHPAIGGKIVVDNFRPVPAPEAIALLHQMEPFVLMDHRKPQAVKVRMIGLQ